MLVGNIGHEPTNCKENAIENKRPTKHHLEFYQTVCVHVKETTLNENVQSLKVVFYLSLK